MSKTITVPDIGMYPIEITLNNKKYTLQPGTEATVPDGVAKLLDQIVASKPKPAEDGWKNAWATIKDAEQYGGKGGDDEGETYETVAEYELGTEITGHQIQNGHLWIVTISDENAAAVFDAVEGGADLYFNSPEMPLEKPEGAEEQSESILLCNNATIEEGTITGLTEPGCAFGVMYSNNTYVAEIVSTEDLSNTTVRILKKASAPSGSDRLVVTLEYVEYDDGGQTRHEWQSDKSYPEIKAALDAKRDVEVLYPYDFDGALTDPMLLHLYPFGYLDASGVIAFSSSPMHLGDNGFSSLGARCLYDADHDETDWEFAWNKIGQPKEFAFTATPDGQSGFTVTPAAGVTYAAILDAVGSTPLVFAKVAVPALGKTVSARFIGIDDGSVSSNATVSATIVEYLSGAYCVMALVVYSDGRMLITVQPIPTQS